MVNTEFRIAVVEHPLLSESVARCFEQMGAQVYRLSATYSDPFRLMEELQPDFLFAVNLVNWSGSREAKQRLFDKLPHCCWLIDPLVNHSKTVFDPDLIHPNYHIFSYDPQLLPHFKKHGFHHVEHLPLAPNGERRPFPGGQDYVHEVSYVGRSLLSVGNEYLTQLQPEIKRSIQEASGGQERQQWEKLLQLFEQGIACQNEDLFDYILPEAISQLETALGLTLPPEEWAVKNPHLTREGLIAVAAKQCCMVQRLLMVQSLAESGIDVDLYGFQDWELLEGPHTHYRGPVAYGNDCMEIFRTSRINLNITRVYARGGIPGRVFDIAGSGGLVMSDYVEEIEELFIPGEEIVCYESYEDLMDKVAYYLHNEEERISIARAGYERVWNSHSLEQRLQQILDRVRKEKKQEEAVLPPA